MFLRKIKQCPAKIWLFLTIGAVNKNIKSKKKFADNHENNILRLFNNLSNFLSIRVVEKEAWLLVINMVYMSCWTSCQTT